MTGSDFASDDADSEPFFARYRELITAVNAVIGCRLLQTVSCLLMNIHQLNRHLSKTIPITFPFVRH